MTMNTRADNGDNRPSSNVREYQDSERREPRSNMDRNARREWVPKSSSHPTRNPNRDFNSGPQPDSDRNLDQFFNGNPNADPNSNRNSDWNSNGNHNPNQCFRPERNRGPGHSGYGTGSASSSGMPSQNGQNQQNVAMRGRGRGNFQRNNYSRSYYNGKNQRSFPRQNYAAKEGIIRPGNVNEVCSLGQSTINEDFSGQCSANEGFIGQSNHVNHPPTETKHSLKQMDLRDERRKLNSRGRTDVPQLVQEIKEKLKNGKVECMICYERVGPAAPVWSCGICYAIFHLHCTRKWADSSAVENSQEVSSWRCPGCQSVQNLSRQEIQYYCFCGKVRDPKVEFYITAHSCGGPCGKPLDKGNKTPEAPCPHKCTLQCHPGPCPTCTAITLLRPCPCGKTLMTSRCNDQNSTESSCGKQCEKPRKCGRHHCENICHEGPCDSCKLLINDASCFCGKTQEKIICGDVEIQGKIDWKKGVFQCGNVCMKMLSCQNHKCSQRCHSGECGECEMLPEKIKSCPCGKTRLENNQRKSCADPVPICSEICERDLPCGKHLCKNTCHNGECAPCSVFVNQKCRCGSSSRTVPCWITTEENDTAEFRCEKICGQKKNCNKHRCNEKCCPQVNRERGGNSRAADSNPHSCIETCGKKLQCGQHLCKEICHIGRCLPCPLAIFDDLSCACGRTTIFPPQPCGTPIPHCPYPCSVPQPCGHPATHNCHPGDCPPCSVHVSKWCVGNHVVKNSPCGSQDILCNRPCGKTRQCGMHACTRTCHLPPCDPISSSSVTISCWQICGAARRDCQHTCTALCHPSTPCPDTRCKSPVQITCSCGRLAAQVPCDAGGSNTKADPVSEAFLYKLPAHLQPLQSNSSRVPIGQRQLVCNDECAKLKKKYAFGLCTGVNSQISDLITREPEWVSDVEGRFRFLVLSKTKGIRLHVFCAIPKEKRDTLKLLAERCNLSVYSAGRDPRFVLIVQATQKSKAPLRPGIDHKGSIPVTGQVRPLPFRSSVDMDPRLVICLFDLPSDANVNSLILRFGGECELVWLNDNNALVLFRDHTRAATALKVVNHASAYQGATEAAATSLMTSHSVWNTTKG